MGRVLTESGTGASTAVSQDTCLPTDTTWSPRRPRRRLDDEDDEDDDDDDVFILCCVVLPMCCSLQVHFFVHVLHLHHAIEDTMHAKHSKSVIQWFQVAPCTKIGHGYGVC